MIDLVDVSKGWSPPTNEPWALVRVADSAISSTNGLILEDAHSAVFQAANNPADIANAIDIAKEWAIARGVANIHIKRPVHPGTD